MRSWIPAAALVIFCSPGAGAQEVIDCNTAGDLAGVQPIARSENAARCYFWSGSTATTRIYHPAAWGAAPNPARVTYLASIREAVAESISAYARLGFIRSLPPVHVGIAPERYRLDPDAAAIADAAQRPARHCDILVFEPEMFPAMSPATPAQLKQLIAHEIFHCVQLGVFPQHYTPAAYWWQEGSAETASGLVYPAANGEHGSTSRFNQRKVLFDHTYPAALFFQDYANEQGIPALISLLRRMPDSDDPAIQYRVLAAMAGFGAGFHHFGQRFLDRRIADPGGGFMAQPEPRTRGTHSITSSTTLTLSTTSFIVDAWRLQFEGGRAITISGLDPADRSLRVSYRYANDPGGWQELEPGSGDLSIITGCDEPRAILVLMTSTIESPAIIDKRVSLVVEDEPCAGCACAGPVPACAAGTWKMHDKAQWNPYWEHLRTLTKGAIGMQHDRGVIDLQIARNGRFSSSFATEASGTSTMRDRSLRVTTSVSGVGAGTVCRTAEAMLCWDYSQSDILQFSEVHLDGALMSRESTLVPPNTITTSRFECRGNRLMIESVYPLEPPLAIEFEYTR